ACEALRLNFRLIGRELAGLGIDVDCAPVLDVPVPGAHDVIGDRAYGLEPAQVAELGRAVCDGLLDEGVLPVIKHIPGHGRAMVDSHLSLPVVDAPRAALEAQDFPPFRALADAPWAMTAHVVYTALDAGAPATTSAKVIGEVIRGLIGFDGVLVSDDLSMKALGGSFEDRTRAALDAGCDLVLHCNGDMAEMAAVCAAVRPLTEIARERVARAAAMKRKAPPLDTAAAAAEVERLLA
ncbi:MAG: glycoside hydrolase family 3 N-terminal domain-containing protein, partial [Actinomycetota bacterium]